ncbi:MAG TPA: hydrogenase maturation protease [Acidimicrobiales bacterium]|nr:hydrogenase maturation protease [Acidimicrobiales bacterium]
MTGASPLKIVVIGLGNPDRGDDAVGPIVAGRAAGAVGLPADSCPPPGPVELLERWQGVDLAVVVDAVRAGDPPGTVRVIDAAAEAVLGMATASTHGLGLACALRLSRAIGRAPGRMVLVGVEGGDFSAGGDLSPAVAEAVPEAVRTVIGLIMEAERCA